jgi:hypothetical protein
MCGGFRPTSAGSASASSSARQSTRCGQNTWSFEALQRQIDQEEEKMMAESEAVLTDVQRTALEGERAKATGKATPGKTAPPKEKAAGKPAGKASPGVGRVK